MQLLIGTYTEPDAGGSAEGILTASFDPVSGVIGPVGTVARLANPSYLTMSADGTRVYAVSETEWFGDVPGGGVAAFARDLQTGDLTPLNAVPTAGPLPCHVSVDPTGRFALVANYGTDAGSLTVYAVIADGRLGTMTSHLPRYGSGPHPGRQAGPHVHMTAADPVTGATLVTDLGLDVVLVGLLDAAGTFTPDSAASFSGEAGAGPRHLAFHPGGQYLFLINELHNSVSVLRRDGGWLTATARPVPVLSADWTGKSTAAAIRVTPSGRHVLVSNRGHDSISVFRFDSSGPSLTLLGHMATPGAVPRDMIVTASGRHVLVACEEGNVVGCYPFDDAVGSLGEPKSVAMPSPVCLVLSPVG